MAGGQRDSDSDSRPEIRHPAMWHRRVIRLRSNTETRQLWRAIQLLHGYPDPFRCGIGRGRAVLRLLSTAVPTPGGVECLLSFQQHPLPRPAGAPRSAARGKLQSRGEALKRRDFGWLIIAGGGFSHLIVFLINRSLITVSCLSDSDSGRNLPRKRRSYGGKSSKQSEPLNFISEID